jgi:hypothetical protein
VQSKSLPADHPCSRANLWHTLEMRVDEDARAYVSDRSRRPPDSDEVRSPPIQSRSSSSSHWHGTR